MEELALNVYEPANIRARETALGLAILFAGHYSIMALLGGPVPLWLRICGFVIVPILFLVLYPFWAARRCGAELLKWPGARRLTHEAVIGIGCGVSIMLTLGSIEYALFGKAYELPEQLRELVVAPDAMMPMVIGVFAVTVVPLGEELFFRGVVYGSLRRWSVPGALAAQAFVFALFHHYGLIYSVFLFVGGVLLGLVYEWRRTLWAPICMHLTCNIISVTVLAMAFIVYGNTPLLGTVLENHDDGCRITRVLPNSSAEAAGLKSGDIVISLDDQPTSHPNELISAIEQFELGSELRLEIKRSGRRMTLTVTLNHTRR